MSKVLNYRPVEHRKDKKKHHKHYARHVQMFHWMMDSDAWKDLSANARATYLEIAKRFNGSNNGLIVYSVREAERDCKIGRHAALRAFRDLGSHGFIVAEQRGHFHWKIDTQGFRRRPATEWRLTTHASDRTLLEATKEFMRWRRGDL